MKVLMGVGLAAWAMLFVSLLFALGFIRVQADAWPPPGSPPPVLHTEAMVGAALLVGAVALWLARRRLTTGHEAAPRTIPFAALWWVGALGVLAAVVLEVRVFLLAREAGGKDAFGTAHRSFLLLHSVHTGVSLLGLLTVGVRALGNRYAQGPAVGPRLWSIYVLFSAAAYAAVFSLVHAG